MTRAIVGGLGRTVAVIVLLSGCDIGSNIIHPGGTRPPDLRDGHGLLVSHGLAGEALEWSPDGRWIYYTTQTLLQLDSTVRRVAPDGSNDEELDLGNNPYTPRGGRGVGLLHSIAFSPSGDDVYVTASPPSLGVTNVLHLSDTAPPAWVPGLDGTFGIAVTPDGRRLVHEDIGERLGSYDLTTGTSATLAKGLATAFSADSRELLYISDSGGWRAIDFSTGAMRSISVRGRVAAWRLVFWPAGDPRVLLTTFDKESLVWGYSVFDTHTSTETPVYSDTFTNTESTAAAWSGDGSTLAVWIFACNGERLLTCNAKHIALYAIGVPDGHETWIAGFDTDEWQATAFSPDGHSLAYTVAGHVYVSSLP